MLKYTVKRLGLALIVMLTVSIISFTLVRASGDIAIAVAGEGATDADIEAIRQQFGFDRPLVVQYFDWAGDVLTGDLGDSLFYREPVVQLLVERMPVTMTLGILSLGFAMLLAIPLGVLAAVFPNSIIDRICLGIAVLGQATPSFWFALLMILMFGVIWPVFPISGTDSWRHFIMPIIVLGYYVIPAIMRITRAGMIEVLESDYIRTAKAKGLNTHAVLFKHALRNAIIPVVSLLAVQLGFMLGGSVVVETIFSINGVGHLALLSIERSDFPMIQGIVLTLAILYILLTLFADILNGWLDPRIRIS
ncbi:MAG: ABC transporter permease [Sneathiella sp.]|jgi:peptide/nickel transport system permease protein|uniref:ABC transporter permease n=1 Tax=Sneathiella sp. TaxID=1964365 RepID=UPI000C36E9E6|nr:ABC transporter permease [Sneathiella sp.]MAL80711.1 ABC transporter permease [Sneathiella sp.]|tara:strand:- start:23 stop:940 length:918 start_codon:yes stop_codon:yes gene_type:complete